jgi:hypothetical protein
MTIRHAALALLLLLAGGVVVVRGGQPGDGGAPTATPDAPPAALCVVAPPPYAHLATAAAAPPPPTPTPGLQPDGPSAPADVALAVGALTRELIACYNAGDQLRAYGLFTDPYLARVFGRQAGFTETAYSELATPRPDASDEPTRIVEIGAPEVIGDDRVGYTLVLAYDSVPMPKRFWVEAVLVGDRWLIDDLRGEISFSVP